LAEITNIAEEIKSRADITDVIGRVVQLKRSGSRMSGLCPFHNEKTASFFVNGDTQSFICFGCGAKGDVISFYERYYNLNFLEAAEKLATEYGIDWAPGGAYDTDSKKEGLYAANREAARYFHNAMKVNGNPAYDYMIGRGITEETLKTFGIGYADGSKSSLCEHLRKAGVSLDDAAQIGLIVGDKGAHRDRYYNRVMFPIVNTRRKVIGFGGRVLGDGVPKYLNSAESRIFLKKNNLYAINITKDEILKEGFSILVEGYMDVISLYQHGIRNVTASLGTALTAAQAAMLKRYANNTVLAYDADAAGIDAAVRGMDILRDAGLNVKVLVLDDTKDPDEFVRKHGREAFRDAAKNAVPFIDFKLAVTRDKHDLSAADGAVRFLRDAAVVLRSLSPVEADYYVKKLAADTGIAEGAIRMEVWGDAREAAIPQRKPHRAPESEDDLTAAADDAVLAIQRNLIRLVLYDSSFVSEVRPHSRIFVTPSLYRIFENIAGLAAENPETDVDVKTLEDMLGDADRQILSSILDTVMLSEDPKQQLAECVAQIQIRALAEREKEILNVLAIGATDDEHTQGLMKQLLEIQENIREIKGDAE
jgi:DNA primase